LELTHKIFPPYVPKQGEEYMCRRQRAHFKKIVESMKDELSQDIVRTVHEMQNDATVFADPNDRASQESDISVELRTRNREWKLIKKIEETIANIENREYGYCRKCSGEIGLLRLRPCVSTARPWRSCANGGSQNRGLIGRSYWVPLVFFDVSPYDSGTKRPSSHLALDMTAPRI